MLNPDIVILFIPVLLSEASIELVRPLPRQVEAVAEASVTLSCAAVGEKPLHTLWTKEGQPVVDKVTWGLAHKGELQFTPVHREDAGEYACIIQNPSEKQTHKTKLIVKGPPERVANVSVHPSTVLATVSWHPALDGGSPITNYSLLYHQVEPTFETKWKHPVPTKHLSPAVHQVDLFHLQPNATYELKIWASNKVGPGEPTSIFFTTLKSPDQSELVRHMLADSDEYTVTAWVLAVSFVMGTIVLLCLASCWLIYKDWKISLQRESPYYDTDDDTVELLNQLVGGTDGDQMDENSNSERGWRFLNNNSVIHPCRV